jgi:HK97 family phage prohead protease
MKHTLEFRSYDLADVKEDKEKRTITGRAVVYNSMSKVLRTSTGVEFREVILPGALRTSLENNDILAYKEHDPAMLLGRRSAGTLRLIDKEDALEVEIDVPETSYGNDLLVSAARGDIKGFSFGFNSPKARHYTRGSEKIREISELNLGEVSVVSSPAYPSTTMSLRNEDFVEEKTVVQSQIEEKTPPDSLAKDNNIRHRFNSLLATKVGPKQL